MRCDAGIWNGSWNKEGLYGGWSYIVLCFFQNLVFIKTKIYSPHCNKHSKRVYSHCSNKITIKRFSLKPKESIYKAEKGWKHKLASKHFHKSALLATKGRAQLNSILGHLSRSETTGHWRQSRDFAFGRETRISSKSKWNRKPMTRSGGETNKDVAVKPCTWNRIACTRRERQTLRIHWYVLRSFALP